MTKRKMQRRGAVVQRVEEEVFRDVRIDRADIIDEEKRIVRLSFASEFPVERWDFFDPWIEVLGHEPDEVDLSRLNAGAVLLYNHERSRESRLGSVVKAWVDNGRSYADVRFSMNPRVDDVWHDVRDGLLTNISVGYFIERREPMETGADGGETPTFRVVRWQPFELSFVDIPADPTVGVGRSVPGSSERGRRYTITDILEQENPMTRKKKGRNGGDGGQRGATLADFLNGAIEALVSDDMPMEDIVASMAEAAGVTVDDVNALLEGSDVCPTLEAISAYAEVLDVDSEEMTAAAEADGCEFSESDEGDGGEGGDGGGDGADGGDGGRQAGNKGKQRSATMSMSTRNKVVRINAERSGIQKERARQQGIRDVFGPQKSRLGDKYETMLNRCLDDGHCSVEKAREIVLDAIGQGTAPGGGERTIEAGPDQRDKFREGVLEALTFRGRQHAVPRDERSKLVVTGNRFRGMSLSELAREACRAVGENVDGLARSEVIARAFTTSDLPNILADVANKSMMLGYEEAPETWEPWTVRGELSDFKAAKRVDLSSFDALQKIGENGEYGYGTISDEGETIQLATYGRIFKITRQTIINDDLNALTELPNKMGRAAARTVGNIVYAALTGNPTLADGVTLFHANHNNLNEGGAAAISVGSLDAMRAGMALQKDSSESANGLNIRPGFILVPVGLEGTAKQIVGSQYDPRTTVNNQVPNIVANIGEVIADPRLDADSATAYYMVAANGFDTIEVAFLDGNDTPFMDQQDEWNVDGASFKVRIDVAAAPRNFRTFQKNDGS